MGNQYLRECESSYVAAERFRGALVERGVHHVSLETDDCGYDGNYGANILVEGNL